MTNAGVSFKDSFSMWVFLIPYCIIYSASSTTKKQYSEIKKHLFFKYLPKSTFKIAIQRFFILSPKKLQYSDTITNFWLVGTQKTVRQIFFSSFLSPVLLLNYNFLLRTRVTKIELVSLNTTGYVFVKVLLIISGSSGQY